MQTILVHGLMGNPENCWFPWLREELKKKGVETQSLKLPRPAAPVRHDWVETLAKAVERPEETILVGHSLGCPTILHFLNEYEGVKPFQHVVLVAGFGRRFLHPKVSEMQSRLLHWLESDLDFKAIRNKAENFTCISSTNDPIVPYEEGIWLAQQLGAELVTEKKQHFVGIRGKGVVKLPSVMRAIAPTLEKVTEKISIQ